MIYFVILNYDNIKKKYKQKNLISHYDALYQAHITKNQNKNDSTKMTLVVFGTLKGSPPHR